MARMLLVIPAASYRLLGKETVAGPSNHPNGLVLPFSWS
jgi:hypothetical protein